MPVLEELIVSFPIVNITNQQIKHIFHYVCTEQACQPEHTSCLCLTQASCALSLTILSHTGMVLTVQLLYHSSLRNPLKCQLNYFQGHLLTVSIIGATPFQLCPALSSYFNHFTLASRRPVSSTSRILNQVTSTHSTPLSPQPLSSIIFQLASSPLFSNANSCQLSPDSKCFLIVHCSGAPCS